MSDTAYESALPLQRAMLANALFSALSGLLLVLFSAPAAGLIGISLPLWPLGLMLLGFAAGLIWLRPRAAKLRAWVWAVVAADELWVLGSLLVIGLFRDILTTTGVAMIAAVATAVLALAVWQWRGLRALGTPNRADQAAAI